MGRALDSHTSRAKLTTEIAAREAKSTQGHLSQYTSDGEDGGVSGNADEIDR